MNSITIIVPAYNASKTIENTIASLLDQTIEVNILVINDGSTDDTEAKVLSLQKDHANIFYHAKANQGIATTRNYALKFIDTEYFGFLDADDRMGKDACASMLAKIEESGSDICFSDFYWEYPDGSLVYQNDTDHQGKHELIRNMFAVLWNKLYRTEWFRECDLSFPDGLVYEDASLLYRLASKMDKVAYLKEPTVYYYQQEGSISRTYNVKINDMISVFEGIETYYRDQEIYDLYRQDLEYLFTRFFLGNSYLRAVRIPDPKLRKETLTKAWDFLHIHFPDHKKNIYLKGSSSKKDLYFSIEGKFLYFKMVPVFRLLYKLKILK